MVLASWLFLYMLIAFLLKKSGVYSKKLVDHVGVEVVVMSGCFVFFLIRSFIALNEHFLPCALNLAGISHPSFLHTHLLLTAHNEMFAFCVL